MRQLFKLFFAALSISSALAWLVIHLLETPSGSHDVAPVRPNTDWTD